MNTLPFTPPYFGFTSNSDLPIKTGLKAWYDYRKGITLDTTLLTETVKEIRDLSGNQYHLTQNTKANQPIYTSGGILLQKLTNEAKLSFLSTPTYQPFYQNQTTIIAGKTVGAKSTHTGLVNIFSIIFGQVGYSPTTPTEDEYLSRAVALIRNTTGQLHNDFPATVDIGTTGNPYPNGASFNSIPSKAFLSSCRTRPLTPTSPGWSQQLTLNNVTNLGFNSPVTVSGLQWNGFRISGAATIDISDNFLLQEIIHYDRTLSNDENARVLKYLQNKYSVIF